MAKFREDNVTFAQAILKIDGLELNIKMKSYGDTMDIGDVEGASQMTTGRTAGQYKTDDCEVEMYAEDFAELVEKFGEEMYNKTFTVTNTYEKLGDSKLTQDELIKCRFNKRAANDQTGPDATTRTVGFKPVFIRWNGKNPLKTMPKGLQ